MARKKQTVTSLKKKLWKVFSQYIRQRDRGICISCGRYAEGSGYHAGHFVTGSICPPSLYFDELNVNGQCYSCNIWKSGNWINYEKSLIVKIGEEGVRRLKEMQGQLQGERWTASQYQEKIDYYRKICNT